MGRRRENVNATKATAEALQTAFNAYNDDLHQQAAKHRANLFINGKASRRPMECTFFLSGPSRANKSKRRWESWQLNLLVWISFLFVFAAATFVIQKAEESEQSRRVKTFEQSFEFLSDRSAVLSFVALLAKRYGQCNIRFPFHIGNAIFFVFSLSTTIGFGSGLSSTYGQISAVAFSIVLLPLWFICLDMMLKGWVQLEVLWLRCLGAKSVTQRYLASSIFYICILGIIVTCCGGIVLPRLFDGDRERGHPLRYKLDAYDGLFYCWTLLSTIGGGDLVFRPKHITDTLAFFICILVGIPVCVLFILSLHRLTRWRIASMLQVRLPTLRSISFFSSSTAAEDFEEQCLAPKRRANLWPELQDEDGDNIKSVSNDLDLNEDIMDIKLEYSKRNMSATKMIAKESRYESSMAKWNKQISMSALQKKMEIEKIISQYTHDELLMALSAIAIVDVDITEIILGYREHCFLLDILVVKNNGSLEASPERAEEFFGVYGQPYPASNTSDDEFNRNFSALHNNYFKGLDGTDDRRAINLVTWLRVMAPHLSAEGRRSTIVFEIGVCAFLWLVLAATLTAGGKVIHMLEQGTEKDLHETLVNLLSMQIRPTLNNTQREHFSRMMEAFTECAVPRCVDKTVDFLECNKFEKQWDFEGSVFYAFSVASTIGFAGPTPNSSNCRLFTVLFSIPAIYVMANAVAKTASLPELLMTYFSCNPAQTEDHPLEGRSSNVERDVVDWKWKLGWATTAIVFIGTAALYLSQWSLSTEFVQNLSLLFWAFSSVGIEHVHDKKKNNTIIVLSCFGLILFLPILAWVTMVLHRMLTSLFQGQSTTNVGGHLNVSKVRIQAILNALALLRRRSPLISHRIDELLSAFKNDSNGMPSTLLNASCAHREASRCYEQSENEKICQQKRSFLREFHDSTQLTVNANRNELLTWLIRCGLEGRRTSKPHVALDEKVESGNWFEDEDTPPSVFHRLIAFGIDSLQDYADVDLMSYAVLSDQIGLSADEIVLYRASLLSLRHGSKEIQMVSANPMPCKNSLKPAS